MARRHVSNQPIRLAAGGFIVNSGVEKMKVDEQRAVRLHGMAKAAFPFFESVPPSSSQRVSRLARWRWVRPCSCPSCPTAWLALR